MNSLKQNNKSTKSPLEPNEIRYRPSPIWVRSLILGISSSVGFGLIFSIVAKNR